MMVFFTQNKGMLWLGIASILMIWKISSTVITSDYLVPSPEQTLIAFFSIMTTRDAILSVFLTVTRGIFGLTLALLLAMITGVVAGINDRFNAFLRPFLVLIRATPVVAFILLLLIWFETDIVPVIIAFLTAYPIICTNIQHGISNVDTNLKEMARVFQLSGIQKVHSLYLPSITAFLFSGVTTAMGFGWRAIVVGEVLSQPTYGVGTRMREAFAYFNVREVIVWTIATIVISYFFETMMRQLEQNVLRWNRK